MTKPRKYFFLLLIPLFLTLLAGVVMLLWNAIVPAVFHWEKLTFWQAAGLLLLSRILFGGFHFGRRGGPPFRRKHYPRRHQWMNLSEEEKARFKEAWKQRFKRE